MKITVILCTFNRCRELANVLSSLAGSRLPDSIDWEILVVDNNSSDQTRDVVMGFSSEFPSRFRYVFEPQPGKSYALNTGTREARGEILAFVDDDVTVDPQWLQNLTVSLQGNEWAGTGGRTLPSQALSLSPWLTLKLAGALCAYFDLGDAPVQLDEAPYGANMAFRKEMFEKYGEFRTDLGPSPNREIPRPNEDTEFGRRLMAAGERLRYEPSAIVYHPIPEDRLTKEYFLAWWFDLGRATIREIGSRRDIWGIPRHYLTMLKYVIMLIPGRTLLWMFTFNSSERFYCKCRVWKTAGEIEELYRYSFGVKRIRKQRI